MPSRPQQLVWAALWLALPSVLHATTAEPPGYGRDTRAYNLAHGRVVFHDKCMRCHESGRKGAPVFGDIEDWAERIEQPLDTLIEHAILGHGRMPARGDQDLSDPDVAAAVAYVVNRTRVIAAGEGRSGVAPTTDPVVTPEGTDRAVVQMFLLLMGKDRWK